VAVALVVIQATVATVLKAIVLEGLLLMDKQVQVAALLAVVGLVAAVLES
jgi:hypothetical protein